MEEPARPAANHLVILSIVNLPLAFPLYLRHPTAGGAYAANTEAMDWFVIATLCFFFFLLGCFAMAAWQIWRRSTRPAPHVELLMELADSDEDKIIQTADEKSAERSPPSPSWERQADWWKR
ncbi:hypothetical protein GCM10023213_37630 [Prosthecobacter algae]|uniref:Uncharacterized protein n=1 Tax=Prosthecobacter algae TaxID=1144682 RepID=A0ABP9PK73_9BACT